MRKLLLFFAACSLSISTAHAASVEAFTFDPSTTITAVAGFSFLTNLVKTTDGGQDGTYNGTANVVAVHQTRGPVTITPSQVTFTGGRINGTSFQIDIAGPIDVTLTDTVTPALTSWAGHVDVGPGAVHHFTTLYQQGPVMRITQPGTSTPGYTPYWVTITAGAPCAVSIVALDMLNNTIPIGATITVSDNYSVPIWSDVQSQILGIASYNWTPNPPTTAPNFTFLINPASPYENPSLYPILGNGVSLVIPTTYYIWISAPATVYAGVPFSVQFSASDSNLYNSPQSSASSYVLQVNALLLDASPGNGTLTPQTVQIGTDGTKTQNFTYTRAETIYLDVSKISPTGSGTRTIERAFSPQIQVMASSPTQISASAAPTAIQAGKTSVISATVLDAYQNPVPNVPVSFTKTQGSAESVISPATAQTNDSGVAQATLTGGITNETVAIECRANTLVASTSVRVSVASPDGDAMINYPNPFDPNETKTSINYFLNYESEMEIRIYDAFGRVVLAKDLKPGQGSGDFANATLSGGANFLWDGRNGEGRVVANGIYLVKVKAKSRNGTQEFKRRVGVIK
ncbi:MAG: Ig-like domain-containing protein [candidate division FCPU426 bacterium]